MKTLQIVAALLLVCSLKAYAQVHFEPGFIINHNGDTLRGQIDYRRKEQNPAAITFKEESSGKETKFRPSQIKAFKVADDAFVSAFVERFRTSPASMNAAYGSLAEVRADTVFLQTLVAGPKSLLRYKDENVKAHFFIKEGDQYRTLWYRESLADGKGSRVITKDERYKQQLAAYLQDCPSLHRQITAATYFNKVLVDLFSSYYRCTQTDQVYVQKAEKFSVKAGVVGGVSLTSLSFEGNFHEEIVKAEYSSSSNAAVGAFLNVFLPISNRKWSVYNELLYSTYKVKGYYQDKETDTRYVDVNTTFAYDYLKLNNFIRYTYPVGKTHLFMNMGLSTGLAVAETNHKKMVYYRYSSVLEKEGPAIDKTKKIEQGLVMGLGGKLRRYSLEYRYERGGGMSPYRTLGSITKRSFLLLGFTF